MATMSAAMPASTIMPVAVSTIIIDGARRPIIDLRGRRINISGRPIINRGTYREVDAETTPIIIVSLGQAREANKQACAHQ